MNTMYFTAVQISMTEKTDDIVGNIETKKFELALQTLSQSPDHPLRLIQIHSELNRSYAIVKYVVAALYGTSAYDKVLDAINKLPRPDTIVPGTLGAYLFGCSTNKCSPLCFNAIPDKESCHQSKQAWLLSGGERIKIVGGYEDDAIVYVTDERDQVLPLDFVDYLAQNEVKKVSIDLIDQGNIKRLVNESRLDHFKRCQQTKLGDEMLPIIFILLLLMMVVGGMTYFTRLRR